MKKKEKYIHVSVENIPFYRGKLIVIISNDKESIKRYIKYFDEEPYGHAHQINYNGFQGFAVVLNFDFNKVKINHGVISHEAFHIANFIAIDRGFIADFNNDEPMAYLIGWITDVIYKTINKYGFKVELKC